MAIPASTFITLKTFIRKYVKMEFHYKEYLLNDKIYPISLPVGIHIHTRQSFRCI